MKLLVQFQGSIYKIFKSSADMVLTMHGRCLLELSKYTVIFGHLFAIFWNHSNNMSLFKYIFYFIRDFFSILILS